MVLPEPLRGAFKSKVPDFIQDHVDGPARPSPTTVRAMTQAHKWGTGASMAPTLKPVAHVCP